MGHQERNHYSQMVRYDANKTLALVPHLFGNHSGVRLPSSVGKELCRCDRRWKYM